MNILVIGYEHTIYEVQSMISEKYYSSTTDCIETCLWNDSQMINQLLVSKVCIYDWYIVAAGSTELSQQICNTINSVFEIPSSKIINYSSFYNATIPYMRVDKRMKPVAYCDGIILGISHAEVGIIPELLPGSFVNLAVSSQDLYYNLKTLEHCIEQYPEKIKHIKHLIIDLFDYTYFNYDVSRSKTFFTYIRYEGFNKDPHNYCVNKNFNVDYDSFLKYILSQNYEGITKEKLELWFDIFEDVHEKNNYKDYTVSDFINNRNNIVTEKDVESYKADTSIVINRYEDTIEENIEIFYQILETAKKINPSINITCLLLPRYIKAQAKADVLYAPWKQEFYRIIDSAKEKYDFNFIDLKDIELASQSSCFHDVSHLNYAGAIVFSNYLSKLIQ